MSKSKHPDKRAPARRDWRTKPAPKSEEDLQPKDAGEMPLEPQDPVQPPDQAT